MELVPVAERGPVTLMQLVLVLPATVKFPEAVILLRTIVFAFVAVMSLPSDPPETVRFPLPVKYTEFEILEDVNVSDPPAW